MDILHYMKSPELVVKFQNYFGIEIVENSKKYNQSNGHERQRNKEFEKNCQSQQSLEKSSGDSWSYLLLGDGTVGSNNECQHETDEDFNKYRIHNWFWYYFFSFATQTGDELFYIVFFPFWNWNIDGAVFRNVIYMWMITMYIGQALKDVIKVPRPSSPPVARLDTKWRLEYGLPSTHAMVAVSIPFSVLTLSADRYQLNYEICFLISLLWCGSVTFSRMYLGMHSVLDIVAGLLLSTALLIFGLPWVKSFDHFVLTHPLSPLIAVPLSISMVVYYPSTDRWTSARGDTTVVVGVGCGCLLGSWLNYQLGLISEPTFEPPFAIMWPSAAMIALLVLRTFLGLLLLIGIRYLFKLLSIGGICAILKVDSTDFKRNPGKLTAPHRLVVELFYKFITYTFIGLGFVFFAPLMFRSLGIERPMFHTEM